MNNDLFSRHPGLARLLAIDLRSLALFRVLLGAVLSWNLAALLPDLTAFYTDAGATPRAWIIASDSASRVSLHFLNGSAWFTSALTLAQLISALMLMAGWRTRLATIASFVLWSSLLSRNPLVLGPGDGLLATLLFWSMFLPLGARYSVDHALAAAPAPAGVTAQSSWSGLGLMLQGVGGTLFTTLARQAPDWQPDHSALYYALHLDLYASPLGQWLQSFPELLHGASALAWWLGLAAPLLLSPLWTQPLRALLVPAFLLLNLAAILGLRLGALPYASIAALGVFVGSGFWDWLGRRNAQRHPGALRIYHDGNSARSLAAGRLLREFLILPRAELAPVQGNPRTRTLAEANRSWVVVDVDDQAHMKWPALLTLLRRSPLLGSLWPLLRSPALLRPANAVYDFLARHPGPPPAAATPVPESCTGKSRPRLAAAAVALLLAMNLAAAGLLPEGAAQLLQPLLRLANLDQRPDPFAPAPSHDNLWLVVPARLADGSELDLLRPERGAPRYGKPEDSGYAGQDLRWRQYHSRLAQPARAGDREQYARYLCRDWNRRHAAEPARRLESFKFVGMIEHIAPDGGPAQMEQLVLSRHECTDGQ